MTYNSRTTPRAHQTEAQRRLTVRPSHPSDQDVMAWLMDMGTGKSKVVIDEWGERTARGDLSDLLVIAPAGSYRNWFVDRSEEEPSELTKHLDPALRSELAVGGWRSGGGLVWKRSVEALLASQRPRAFCVNVEALSTVRAAREACAQFLRSSRHGAMVAVDESTTIRTPGTERTKAVLQLAELAAARRILTGLPAPRSPMDMFSQFEFLDWRILGFRSFRAFQARYAILRRQQFNGRWFMQEVGYRDIDEVQARIAPYSYRVLKEDCLDLEPKVYTSRDVPLTAEQERLYRELREYATAELGEEQHVTATSVITQILRLHQLLCGHVVTETGELRQVSERRTEVLLGVLDEHRGKAIIWVTYGATLRRLASALGEKYGTRSVACYWGGNTSSREDDEHRFKTDPDCRFMLSTPGAGGRGNTWVVADLVVYYANTYDLEQRQQSEDRAHRDGQLHRVTYVDLVARGTVDEKILLALRRKINLATTITGENYREWLI